MKLSLKELRDGPYEYRVDLGADFLAEEVEENVVFGAARGVVVFELMGKEVVARGELASTMRGACGRCLAPTEKAVRVDVNIYFRPRSEGDRPQAVESDADEPDYATYDGGLVEPDPELREIMVLEASEVMLCVEDCKGLCPECGANRNTETCACEADEDKPESNASTDRWKSQLKNLELPADTDGE